MARICKKCGGEVGANDFYCIHCGMPLEKEREEWKEENKQEERNLAEPLSVGAYLLVGILLLIPVVNIIVPIIWILNKNGNPNRRNLAKAWLILAVVGTVLTGILSFGLFQFFVMDHYVPYDYHFEYTFPGELIPDTQFLEDFPVELNEI